jgi:hypothetical protein
VQWKAVNSGPDDTPAFIDRLVITKLPAGCPGEDSPETPYPVGGPTLDDAVRVLAIDGKLLVIGFAPGAIPSVKISRLLLRDVGVLGVAWRWLMRRTRCGRWIFNSTPPPTGGR